MNVAIIIIVAVNALADVAILLILFKIYKRLDLTDYWKSEIDKRIKEVQWRLKN